MAFCLCGSLYLRDPGSFALCLLGRFALDLAGGFTLRLLRRLALRAFGSLDLRFLSGFALCLPRGLALGFSRSVALRLLGSFTLRSLDGFEPRLLCRLALRLLRGFAPGFLRGGKPCSLGCGFATRGLSPGLFSKRVELWAIGNGSVWSVPLQELNAKDIGRGTVSFDGTVKLIGNCRPNDRGHTTVQLAQTATLPRRCAPTRPGMAD